MHWIVELCAQGDEESFQSLKKARTNILWASDLPVLGRYDIQKSLAIAFIAELKISAAFEAESETSGSVSKAVSFAIWLEELRDALHSV